MPPPPLVTCTHARSPPLPQAHAAADGSDSDDGGYDHLLDELDQDPEGLRLRREQEEAAMAQMREAQRRRAYGFGTHGEVGADELEHIVQV
jgi:hypothetical protein